MAYFLTLVLILIICCTYLVASWPNYGEVKIRGANLGSWLVLEKWITPDVFSGLPDWVNDEYKLCQHLGYAAAEKRLRAHWDSWVTEQDIINLKNAGINHIRIPIGYWALDIKPSEPWVWGSFEYMVKACGWAKKYGLQVMIVLHGAPGSQNGQDHSGKSGSVDFFYNDENLNRATTVLSRIASWANSPEWQQTVSILEVLNEPILWEDYNYRLNRLKQFYRQAYDEIRRQNSGIVVAVHDAFISYNNWYYLRDDPHYYWIMLDTHLYQVFNDEWKDYTCEQHAAIPCKYLGALREANQKLWTVVGEWSLATPKLCSNQATFAKQQIGVYESAGSGWIMWNFKHAQGWKEWSFLDSIRQGWINLSQQNNAQC